MKAPKILAAMLMMAAPLAAQDASDIRALKLRFGHAATRAIANFRSADSVERNLQMQGNTLHPTLLALRMRIEAALDESEAALNKGEFASADGSIRRAEGLIDRFGKRLGGD